MNFLKNKNKRIIEDVFLLRFLRVHTVPLYSLLIKFKKQSFIVIIP